MTKEAHQRFDRTIIDRFHTAREVDIETTRPSGEPRMTTIWILTDGSDVYVRSERGTEGHWYREAIATHSAVLHLGSDRFAIRVTPANDSATVALVDELYRTKYGAASQSTQAMLQPNTLETTLRLEPRDA
jgi:hypothetical protein